MIPLTETSEQNKKLVCLNWVVETGLSWLHLLPSLHDHLWLPWGYSNTQV